ncbi:MAG: hypothetical protein Q9191_006598 [Dirinaria sp. TL-2023a]
MTSAISSPPTEIISPNTAQEAVTSAEATSVSNLTDSLRQRHSHSNSTRSAEPSTTKEEQAFAAATQPHHPITNAILSPPPGEFFINLILQVIGIVAAIAFGVFAVQSLNVAKTANTLTRQALEEARIANQAAMLSLCTQATDNVPSFCGRVLGNENLAFQSQVTSLFTARLTGTVATTKRHSSSSSALSFSSAITASTGDVGFSTAEPSTTSTTRSEGTPPPTVSPTTVPIATPSVGSGQAPAPSTGPSSGAIIGIAVSVGAVLMVIAVVTMIYLRRRKKASMADGTSEDAYDATLSGKEEALLGSRPPVRGWRRWWKVYRALFMESRVSTSN